MNLDTFTTIAIAAAVGAIAKEFFTAGIKYSVPTAKKILKGLPAIIRRHLKLIDLIGNLAGLIYLFFVFFIFDKLQGSDAVSHFVVRFYVLIGIAIIAQFYALRSSLVRIMKKDTEQGADSAAEEAV